VCLAACAASQIGCTLALGNGHTGTARAHDEPDFVACLERATSSRSDTHGDVAPPPESEASTEAMRSSPECAEEKTFVKHVPERSYSTFFLPLPTAGAAWASRGGETNLRLRLDLSSEYVRGRGPNAFGLRVSGIADVEDAIAVSAVPTYHRNVGERLSFHVGAGPVPYARRGRSQSFFGGRGLVGARYLLGRTGRDTFYRLTLEGDVHALPYLAPRYTSVGVVASIGIVR
jgi:hypothetical protein